jgi:predicted nucleic acid-binding protein
MNGTKIIFDTCAAILFLKGEYEPTSLGFDIDKAKQYISVITRMEIMAKRNMTPEEEQVIHDFIADVTVVPLDETVEQKAIELRRSTKLKLPDCIVAATAIILDAVLLTADDHLLCLSWPGFQTQNII